MNKTFLNKSCFEKYIDFVLFSGVLGGLALNTPLDPLVDNASSKPEMWGVTAWSICRGMPQLEEALMTRNPGDSVDRIGTC